MEQTGYKCMDGTRQKTPSYNNQQSDDYLTPTNPASELPPQLPAFPPGFGRSKSQPNGTHSSKQPLPRADSGIESDYPRSPLSSTSTGARASTVYEYIDPHDVQVNPRLHDTSHGSVNQGESSSSGVSSSTTASSGYTATGDMLYDSEDGTLHSDGVRRRVNPMYEALEKSATRLYAQTCHCRKQSTSQKWLRFLCCAFIIIIIILLAVIAYMFIALIPSLKSHMQTQEDKLTVLESAYADLYQQNASSHQLSTASPSIPEDMSPENTSQADSMLGVVEMITQLNNSVQVFHSQLQNVSADLQQQIHNISLTPGPQGPPGAGNLSSCFYHSRASNVALPASANFNDWQPSIDLLQDNVVMSAACEVVKGTEQSLETQQVPNSDTWQYRCRCDGQVEQANRRTCRIHMVLCPRPSRLELVP